MMELFQETVIIKIFVCFGVTQKKKSNPHSEDATIRVIIVIE